MKVLVSAMETSSNIHLKELKKYFSKKKNLKFVMLSGIFSEEHSEAIQIINF